MLTKYRILKRLAKALIRLRVCTGWFEALLVAHTTLLEISCAGSYIECYELALYSFFNPFSILERTLSITHRSELFSRHKYHYSIFQSYLNLSINAVFMGVNSRLHILQNYSRVLVSQNICDRPIATKTLELWHEIAINVVCATYKASDQPAHTRSLIRAFASRMNIKWVLSYWPNIIWVSKLKKRLHRLVWVYTCQNATFLEITCRRSFDLWLWNTKSVIHLQFRAYGPGTRCFAYQWVQLQTYESRTLF